MESLLLNLGVDTSLMCLILVFLAQGNGLEFHWKKGGIWSPKVKSSKGYNLINMSTQISFVERSVQFEEEPMLATEIGESSSPTPPLIVSE